MNTPHVPIEILLVEDQDDEIERIEEAIGATELHNRMVVARNGIEALLYLRQSALAQRDGMRNSPPPGLILLDVNMEGKRGFDVLHELRTDPHLMTIPVVILTDSLDSTDLACTMSHGVTGYFLKPMDGAQLQKVVKDVEEHWSLLSAAPCAN